MPEPTVYSVHANRPLTQISTAYIQEQEHFIAHRVFPLISVDKRSDSYYKYTQADWFRDEARPRADSTESAGSGYNVSTATYTCNVYALHKDIGDQVVANSDKPLSPFADATRFLTQKMLLKQEITWVTDYFSTSKWGTDVTGGTNFTVWSNYATSDPIADIETGKTTILQNTGYMPNALVLGYEVFVQLKNHPAIIDRIKYTTNVINAPVTTQLLAALFEVKNVYVARAVKNSAVQNATDNYAFTHGSNALLLYSTDRPGLLEATAGYTFAWKGISDGLGANVGISRFRMPHLRADRVEAQMAWDNKLVAANLGYFFSGATS
jgi:hypothetical protein